MTCVRYPIGLYVQSSERLVPAALHGVSKYTNGDLIRDCMGLHIKGMGFKTNWEAVGYRDGHHLRQHLTPLG